jgi:glycosyltransferase involved in cell wall biosynthesis
MVKQKHILFIVENNPVPQDGRVWSEAIVVREMGFRVSIICPATSRYPKRHETLDGINIYRHPRPHEGAGVQGLLLEYGNAFFWELLLSLRIFLANPFHVIHSANPPDHVFLIALPYKLLGVKYIFDHHDISPENYVAKFQKKGIIYRLLLIMERLSFWTADMIISTNESYKNIAISRGKKKADDIVVVRNGPNLDRIIFKPPRTELKSGFKYLVAYLGIIAKQDGLETLLKAIDYIVYKKNYTDILFYIIGTGTQWHELISLSKKLQIDNYVKFTGFIPFEELYEILSTADLCVNPEFCNDFTDKSTMVKIMEYMTFGKPIVQFLTTEGKVTAGDAALYIVNNNEIDFAHGVIELLEDPEKRKEMGTFAQKRIVNELCWDKQKVNLQRVYDRLFSDKRQLLKAQ